MLVFHARSLLPTCLLIRDYLCCGQHFCTFCAVQVAVSIANHMQDLPDYTHSVKVATVANPTKENLTAAWKQWVESAGTKQLSSMSELQLQGSNTVACTGLSKLANLVQVSSTLCYSGPHEALVLDMVFACVLRSLLGIHEACLPSSRNSS